MIGTEFRRYADGAVLASAATVYVSVADGKKVVVTDEQRAALLRGAPGVVVDHAGT